MRIEALLIFIVSVLMLLSVLGVGVAIGGGQEASSNIYLDAISTVADCLSGVVALCTLILLMNVRNDWLRPKEHEAMLELKHSALVWLNDIKTLNLTLCGFTSYGSNQEALDHFMTLEAKEKESWSKFQSDKRRYELYFPNSSLPKNKLGSIKSSRNKIYCLSNDYRKYIGEPSSSFSPKEFSEIETNYKIETDYLAFMKIV